MLNKIPVLLIGFNRPDLIKLALENLASLGIKNLYVSLDGPRNSKESIICRESLTTVLSYKKTFNLHLIYRDYNLGCNLGVISALDWFFSHVNYGVVLEDDCIIDKDGLSHFEYFLDNYKEFISNGIGIATAHNPFKVFENCKTTQYTLVSGWASSSYVWNLVRQNYYSLRFPTFFMKHLESQKIQEKIFWWANSTRAKLGGIDTWDSIFIDQLMRKGLKTLIPKKNSVDHVGYGPMATHTKSGQDRFLVDLPSDFQELGIDSLLRDFYYKIRRRHVLTPCVKVLLDLLRFTRRRNFELDLAEDTKNRIIWKLKR